MPASSAPGTDSSRTGKADAPADGAPREAWDKIDEVSAQSFPASDPPGFYNSSAAAKGARSTQRRKKDRTSG